MVPGYEDDYEMGPIVISPSPPANQIEYVTCIILCKHFTPSIIIIILRKSPETFESAMSELVEHLRPPNFSLDFEDDDDVLQIHVRRKDFLVSDSIREGGKRKFVPRKKLKVGNIAMWSKRSLIQITFFHRLSLL